MTTAKENREKKEKQPSRKRILLIEDDFLIIKAYQMKFESEGWSVTVAMGGAQALLMVKKDAPPDCVILDLMLPEVSGYEILEVIRTAQAWKNVPVIVLTNLSQAADRKRAEALGIQGYFIKADTKIADIAEKIKTAVK